MTPYTTPVVKVTKAAAAAFGAPVSPLRILIVDDDHINLSILSTLLKRRFSALLDGAPIAVDGGLKAIQALRQDVFDIVLLDVQMPGIDGVEVCKRIRTGSDGILAANQTAHVDDAPEISSSELSSTTGSSMSSDFSTLSLGKASRRPSAVSDTTESDESDLESPSTNEEQQFNLVPELHSWNPSSKVADAVEPAVNSSLAPRYLA
ncbi:histidine kinase [Ceraceosorus bombacis]|uniref:Histidine kinase n=1 Tax=Ceraceosorus bombacis TaxID=401625 RepID=A0A0P1B9F0_9BASI|nr:histidine kinase [Ceraceosorus bombacis]